MPRTDPLSYGVALLGLGTGTLALTILSLAEPNVSYARTVWTALLSMALAAPAAVLYPLGTKRDAPAWRAFWTAGLAAFLLHFWWAIARIYDGDIGAIVAHQGAVAFTNLLVTLLWAADVLLSWWPFAPSRVAVVLRFFAWLVVTVSFVIASAVLKTGLVALLGMALGTAVLFAVAWRVVRWWQSVKPLSA